MGIWGSSCQKSNQICCRENSSTRVDLKPKLNLAVLEDTLRDWNNVRRSKNGYRAGTRRGGRWKRACLVAWCRWQHGLLLIWRRWWRMTSMGQFALIKWWELFGGFIRTCERRSAGCSRNLNIRGEQYERSRRRRKMNRGYADALFFLQWAA
jgi:hypothetical protein